MKRNPMKPQLQNSLKPLLENKLKTNILQLDLTVQGVGQGMNIT
jgi:hypothetical protein